MIGAMPFAVTVVQTLLVPVKPTGLGKSRLHPYDAGSRRRLARAFALDTVTAGTAAGTVDQVVVVTVDAGLVHEVERLGCRTLVDTAPGDLNATLLSAALLLAREAAPGVAVRPVALCADLPALTSAALDDVLGDGSPVRALVADHAGTGTTLLRSEDVAGFRPAFGDGSAARHRALGHVDLPAADPLRRDVDDARDLEAAALLGLGRHTREALVTAVQEERLGG